MKKIMLLSLLVAGAPAFAEGLYQYDGYFGGSFNLLTQETGGDDIEPTGLQFRMGAQINPYVAVEGRIGHGVNDDEVDGLTIDPEWLLGAYLKVGLDKNQPVAPYLLLGHSTAIEEVTTETETLLGTVRDSEDRTASDPSYGAGVEVNLNQNTSLNAEWLQLDDDDGFDLTTINIGILQRF